MKEIPLTQGFVALVDDEDQDLVAGRNWLPAPRGSGTYAVSYKQPPGERRICTLMHRLILNAPRGIHVDHVNGDCLDNRRSNLRLATTSQNLANSRATRGLSFFKGVTWHGDRSRWRAQITLDQRRHFLGRFAREEDAAHAYDAAARERFGTFAALNFPRPGEQSAHRTPDIGESMPAVTLGGTFGKNERPSNGLEDIADDLVKDQLKRHYVVGVVQFAGATVPGHNEELVPRVKFLAIEPLAGSIADDVQRILDGARRSRGLGRIEEEQPTPTLFDFTDDDGSPEVRMGPDGEHVVPPPSGEELTAEREEAKAAKAKPTTTPFVPDGAA